MKPLRSRSQRGKGTSFREKFARSTDDAIRPKKGEPSTRVATPGTRPEASGAPELAALFRGPVKPS
jgi:hypothetical protein